MRIAPLLALPLLGTLVAAWAQAPAGSADSPRVPTAPVGQASQTDRPPAQTPTVPTDHPQAATSRKFDFRYAVSVAEIPREARTLRLWIPVPPSNGQQEVTGLSLKSPVSWEMRRQGDGRNRVAFLEIDPRKLKAPLSVEMRFTAERRENRANLSGGPRPTAGEAPPDLARYLRPDRLVPLDGVIADLAKQQTATLDRPLQKARAIYDYVLSTMKYDKTGEGWGRGDAIYACNVRKGNCTDFHALFIGMMRAAGIPARFEIGFPLPRDRSAGEIAGYHCWAQFWIDGRGWVPVDASEGWKDPARRDYFFGAHDANRVLFTEGRDLRLDPPQQGEPLNFFVYPYAELDGKPWSGWKASYSFQDVGPAAASAGVGTPRETRAGS